MSFWRDRRWRRWLSTFVGWIGAAVFLAGVALGAYTALQWLRAGRAQQMLVQDAIGGFLPLELRRWIAHPESWYGLRDIIVWIDQIPLFAALLFVGFVILLASKS